MASKKIFLEKVANLIGVKAEEHEVLYELKNMLEAEHYLAQAEEVLEVERAEDVRSAVLDLQHRIVEIEREGEVAECFFKFLGLTSVDVAILRESNDLETQVKRILDRPRRP